MRELIRAMDSISGMSYIITLANADAGGRVINDIWREEGRKRDNWLVVPSLGVIKYLSAMKYSRVVIGNSSSGIVEAPSLGIPSVNVGDRQKGRMMAESVVACLPEWKCIQQAIQTALQPEFRERAKKVQSPFGNGDTSALIEKHLMDYLDDQMRKAYFSPDRSEENGLSGDLMWYLWLGPDSPLFGKEKMTTFERLFIDDKATHKEPARPYYKMNNERWLAEKILKEFNLDPNTARILNGHVPVKIKNGESPIKGGGLIYVIDGGISKAYQKDTGIAGYTLIYNSRGMMLAEHKPYKPINPDGTQEFTSPTMKIVYTLPERKVIMDTDSGRGLVEQVNDLMELIRAFKEGLVKEEA